jgi:hypothetical protein
LFGDVIEELGREVLVKGERRRLVGARGEVEIGEQVEQGREDVGRARDGSRLISKSD